MNEFTKLDQLRAHLLRPNEAVQTQPREKRVQKNLSILESDARRLKSLAKAEGISQARLLSLALDAFVEIEEKN